MLYYICALPNRGVTGKPKELFTNDPEKVDHFARENDQPGWGVYDCMNRLMDGARHRNLQTIGTIWRLSVDLDFKDIEESPEQVDKQLHQLPLSPTEVRDSGGGRHGDFILREPIERGDPDYARAEALLKRLTACLCGDPAVAHVAALLRRPGTHNSKRDIPGPVCTTLWNSGAHVTLEDIEGMLDLLQDALVFTRKPGDGRRVRGANTSRSGPIDVEARLAAMRWKGRDETAIHWTQLQCIGARMRQGVMLDDAVTEVLDATRRCVAGELSAQNWDWKKEEFEIVRMGLDLVCKEPELAPCLNEKLWRQYQDAMDLLKPGEKLSTSINAYSAFFRSPHSPRKKEQPKASQAQGTKKTADATDNEDQPAGWNLYDKTRTEPPRWLIKGILPESGVAIIPGQWGSYKTTTALDLALSVMTSQLFAGRYRVKRAGAVLYFAVEGAGTIQSRLAAIASQRGAPDKLPFAWRADCPLLTAKDAGPAIARHYDAAAAYFQRVYKVPTSLILIDTYAVAAGFTMSGDDSDTAATQKAFSALRYVHKHTGAAVVVVDHFGKVIEAGTRGSSNKEGNADAVLATLADKELSGTVSNTRLAVRKQRDGISGFEIPFSPQVIELGLDEDGDPITAVVIDWGTPRKSPPPLRKLKDLTLLCSALVSVIAKSGFPFRPDPGGATVQACHGADLRTAFLAQRPKKGKSGDSTARTAYGRTLQAAVDRGLMGMKDTEGQTIIWKR